ncbi:hypothetical protein, partial [Lactococcus lactis]|uniref:hypothetical protein n=1 Tax=Lactococcus lactis TaxID=1358 RepID=UPI00207329E1
MAKSTRFTSIFWMALMASHAITIYFVTAFFTLHLIPHFTTLSKSSHAWYLPFIFTILKSSRLTDFLVNWSFSTV